MGYGDAQSVDPHVLDPGFRDRVLISKENRDKEGFKEIETRDPYRTSYQQYGEGYEMDLEDGAVLFDFLDQGWEEEVSDIGAGKEDDLSELRSNRVGSSVFWGEVLDEDHVEVEPGRKQSVVDEYDPVGGIELIIG